MIAASAANIDLGLPTFIAALAAVAFVAFKDRHAPVVILKDVSWSVLPLVAGLFILVATIDKAGALAMSRAAIHHAANLPPVWGGVSSAFCVALLSNIANNLPVGLITGSTIQGAAIAPHLRDALVIGVDLGPNLSVTGSLATILWLVALRRDGENVTAWQFLKYGLAVMPPALLLAVAALSFAAK